METWAQVRASALAAFELLDGDGDVEFDVPVASIAHPRDAGAVSSTGLPRGQDEDWRFPPTQGCRGVHVQRFGEVWRVHVDSVHPSCSVVGHARADAPALWVGGATLLGLAIGAMAGRSVAGAFIGSALGIATLPRRTRTGERWR